MRHVTVGALILCLVIGVAPVRGAAADLQVGYVNFAKVLEGAPQAQQAREKLEEEFAPRQRKLAAEQEELNEMESSLERDGAVMSESARREQEREIVGRRRELRREQEAFREDLNIRQNEAMSELQARVHEAVVDLAEKEDYDLIVTDGVLYASDRVDITESVIDSLEARFDGSSQGGR